MLRKGSQALKNNSLFLRNESKELTGASHDIKIQSYILRKE